MRILQICPTINSPTCGIGKYSRYLYGALQDNGAEQFLLDGTASIHSAILKLRPRIVHLQLEYGFCSPERLELITEYCGANESLFLCTFHTLAHVPHNVAGGNGVTRLSHYPDAVGFGDFRTIPMGIPPIRLENQPDLTDQAIVGFLQRKPTMIFGQAHPHKSIFECLKFVERFETQNLICLISKPIAGDTAYYDKCQALAQKLPNVLWVDRYLEDGEVLWVASRCRRAILPYTEYGAIGISAAVKLLLTLPTLEIFVSDVSHFADIPNRRIVDRGRTIEQMFLDSSGFFREHREQFVTETSFDSVAKLLLGIYEEQNQLWS